MFTKQIQPKNEKVQENIITPTSIVANRVNYSAQLGASSTHQQIFHISLGDGNQPYDTTDPSVLWRYNIPTLVPGQKRRIIEISSFSGVLVNYTSTQFPTKIGLCFDNFVGYQSLKWVTPPTQAKQLSSWQTIPTNVAQWSVANQINCVIRQGGLLGYNVCYSNPNDVAWDVGLLPQLVVRITDPQGNYIAGPFNNPMELTLRIMHVGL